jgi:hypothetical protein
MVELDEVKNYLNITWDDEATDRKLAGVIARCTQIINGWASEAVDFDKDESAKQLLFDLIRYVHNNAYELFPTNFGGEITMLRERYRVKRMKSRSKGE